MEQKSRSYVGVVIFSMFIFLGLFFAKTFNSLNHLDQDVKEAWSNIEADYQRRMDLLPNMVSIVQRYAKHEKGIFKDIADARSRYAGAATPGAKIKAQGELDSFFSRLMMIVENYPNLKANEQFTRLMDQWEGTENRIKVSRMRYNEVAKRYNYTAKSFAGRFWVNLFGFDKEKAYFQAVKGAETAPNAKELMGEE